MDVEGPTTRSSTSTSTSRRYVMTSVISGGDNEHDANGDH